MNQGEIIYLAGGFILGVSIILVGIYLRNNTNKLLSVGQLRKLNLDGEDSEIARAFTHSKKRQIQIAEQKVEEIDQIVKQKLKSVEKSEDALQGMRKKLSSIIDKIEAAETKGEKQDFIKNNLAGHLKLMADESMEYSTALDAHLRFRMSLRFWKQVQNGEGKKTSIATLTKRPYGTGDQDNRLNEVLASANETLRLGESDYDRAMETWVYKADSV